MKVGDKVILIIRDVPQRGVVVNVNVSDRVTRRCPKGFETIRIIVRVANWDRYVFYKNLDGWNSYGLEDIKLQLIPASVSCIIELGSIVESQTEGD
jgi:hypothetical protein